MSLVTSLSEIADGAIIVLETFIVARKLRGRMRWAIVYISLRSQLWVVMLIS